MADELKAKGNAAFSSGNFEEAITYFTQAIEVDPSNHVLYSNRSASHASLKDYGAALEDAQKAADKCIELKPDFAKGYSRKGALQFFMKEWDKAIETYQKGLALEPDNQELKDGLQRAIDAIGRFASGAASAEEVKDRQNRSMADPEVQHILKDPIMQNVLRDFQEDPRGAQKHLGKPEIMAKINKLVAAGIIQVK
ncbi:Heat shock protein STI [Tetrabaena socialis]|uniref:Heat shock protein STI n=1 Tax=Tetrabaena socialis TaxID=47790 RepID=A0A2J7ZTH3_9CHLO|nr:Heat shock protein STI [Tetrabaena socialis]|eukprot:PNH03569.1 Heat shock protein STI [Tetrabaena socialis]